MYWFFWWANVWSVLIKCPPKISFLIIRFFIVSNETVLGQKKKTIEFPHADLQGSSRVPHASSVKILRDSFSLDVIIGQVFKQIFAIKSHQFTSCFILVTCFYPIVLLNNFSSNSNHFECSDLLLKMFHTGRTRTPILSKISSCFWEYSWLSGVSTPIAASKAGVWKIVCVWKICICNKLAALELSQIFSGSIRCRWRNRRNGALSTPHKVCDTWNQCSDLLTHQILQVSYWFLWSFYFLLFSKI